MIAKRIREIMLRYGVPFEYLYRLPGDSECISYPDLIEVTVCKETFRTRLCLPLYPFVEKFLS